MDAILSTACSACKTSFTIKDTQLRVADGARADPIEGLDFEKDSRGSLRWVGYIEDLPLRRADSPDSGTRPPAPIPENLVDGSANQGKFSPLQISISWPGYLRRRLPASCLLLQLPDLKNQIRTYATIIDKIIGEDADVNAGSVGCNGEEIYAYSY